MLGILGFALAMAIGCTRTDKSDKPACDPKDKSHNGIEVHFGEHDKDWMDVDEDLMWSALDPIDEACYNVDYYPRSGKHKWPRGGLNDVHTTDISIPKEIGGMSDQASSSSASSQPNGDPRSTQLVTLQTVEALQKFADTLKPSGATAAPTPTSTPTP